VGPVPLILLCDDDEDEPILIRQAFEQADIHAKLIYLRDGIEMTEYLQSCDLISSKTCPKIIILDLNMPRMNGLETLKWIKSRPQYDQIPVIIHTTSSAEGDFLDCHMAGANSVITKSRNPGNLVRTVSSLSWS